MQSYILPISSGQILRNKILLRPLKIIKIENDDLEKQENSLFKSINLKALKKFYALVLLLTIAFPLNSFAQSGDKYIINEITVTGNTSFNASTIITYSRLKKGQEVTIGGDKIGEAVKKLWTSNLFSSIDIYFINITEDKKVDIEINLSDLPELNEVRIDGVKKGKKDEIIDENNLRPKVKVTENLVTTTKNYLTNKYKKKGFLNTKVNVITSEIENDSIEKKRVNMLVSIDKGNKVKFKSIKFNGNDKLSDKKLRKAMKNTKQKSISPLRLLKRSKYVEEDYNEDLISIIDKYKENGYRDARVIKDSLIYVDDKTISLLIDVEEGEKYTFGKIDFVGNTVYTDEFLSQILRIEEGDTYNGVELRKRIANEEKPDGIDITNVYQNTGYMFSTINPLCIASAPANLERRTQDR